MHTWNVTKGEKNRSTWTPLYTSIYIIHIKKTVRVGLVRIILSLSKNVFFGSKMDATSIGLNADFGYVILVTISAIIMSWRVGYQVVSARKKFNVQVGDG